MANTKQEKLNSLSEDAFRSDVIIPLLRNMGYTNVRLHHGPAEYGKDIICQFKAPLSIENIAVVAKVGNLTGAAKPNSLTLRLADVKEQISQAFRIPIEDATLKSPTNVNRVFVWISGTITNSVDHQVTNDNGNSFVNVDFIDGSTTIEKLNELYPSYWTIGDYNITTYFSNARKKYSELDELLALGVQNSHRKLPTIFISPKLELIEQVRSKQARQQGLPRKTFAFSRLLKIHPQNTAIIGGLGTGKSTALRRMLLQIIEINETELKKYPLPVYLKFRELDQDNTTAIRDAISNEFKLLATDDEPADLEELLERGDVVVLIDGLDELETEENINKGIRLLTSFIDKYKYSRVVFTSRSLEIFKTSNVLAQFSVYRMLNLDFQQIQTLIRKWFEESDKDGEQLIKLISNPVTFASLPHTPLTLALLATLYDRGIQDLPANLTELLEKYVEITLGRWDMDKGIQQQIEWRIKQNLLGQLAWELVQTNQFSMSFNDIQELVEKQRDEVGLSFDSKAIVNEIVQRSGLLIPDEDGNFVFKHYSFLSYFAGYELTVQSDGLELVAEHFYDIAWSRIIFFACGIKRDDKSYLEKFVNEVHIPDSNILFYAMQLGLVTQASFLTPLSLKAELIKRAILSFVLAWDELATKFDDVRQSEKKPRQISQADLLIFICAHLNLGLGSPILQRTLETVVEETLESTQVVDNSENLNQAVQFEWFQFFLAIACINAEAISSFAKLLDGNIIRNPMLLAFCEMYAEFMLDVGTLTEKDKNKLTDQIRLIGKKLKGRRKEIGTIFDESPNLIQLPARISDN